ncbi:RICIN domain-containing protein [Streptomyces lushanensis]|uniref:RICIN domain-containing protein n=1 Tax=Streptomyces lushanensis TaxID=1434255 RepID=UPI000A6A4B15|nr:RICIN domain-containing protein [Streptomyces lushanensis]
MSVFRKGALKSAAVGLAGVSALLFASPANAAPAGVNTYIGNLGTGKCLAVPGASQTEGTETVQWGCGSSGQVWEWIPVSSDHWKLRNTASGQCLAIAGGTGTNGANAIQWPCGSGSEQVWIWDSAARLRNVASDRCLAVPNSSTANGTKVVQWTCSTSADQQWVQVV